MCANARGAPAALRFSAQGRGTRNILPYARFWKGRQIFRHGRHTRRLWGGTHRRARHAARKRAGLRRKGRAHRHRTGHAPERRKSRPRGRGRRDGCGCGRCGPRHRHHPVRGFCHPRIGRGGRRHGVRLPQSRPLQRLESLSPDGGKAPPRRGGKSGTPPRKRTARLRRTEGVSPPRDLPERGLYLCGMRPRRKTFRAAHRAGLRLRRRLCDRARSVREGGRGSACHIRLPRRRAHQRRLRCAAPPSSRRGGQGKGRRSRALLRRRRRPRLFTPTWARKPPSKRAG